MGKLILCTGNRTMRPYVFGTTGCRIYSIEELCYYICNNLYFIDESLFSDSFLHWIGSELGLTGRAEKLEQLKVQRAEFKTLLAAVLCSCDYYSEQEIKRFLMMVDEISTMPPVKRRCIKANGYLEKKQYAEAVAEYESILESGEAAALTPEGYGDILHSLAVAKVHTAGPAQASEYFLHAYERNRREESLRQYLYTLWLGGNRQLFQEKLEEYQVDAVLCRDILQRMEELSAEAYESPDMDRIKQLKKMRSQGRLTELRKLCEEMIEEWITAVRQI